MDRKEYTSSSDLIFRFENFEIRQAQTLAEKLDFLALRYQIYTKIKYIDSEKLSETQNQLKLEWDEHDRGGKDTFLMDGHIRYILAYQDNECIGGARIIDGECPLEQGVCLCDSKNDLGFSYKTGEKFSLKKLRENGIKTREISRLIVHKKAPKGVLENLFCVMEALTSDNDCLFCTAKKDQAALYQAIGFEIVGPPIKYTLSGEWFPMMRSRYQVFKAPHTIEGFEKEFHDYSAPLLKRWNIPALIEQSVSAAQQTNNVCNWKLK